MTICHNIRFYFYKLFNKEISSWVKNIVIITLVSMSAFTVKAAQRTIVVTPAKLGYYDFYETFGAVGQSKSENSRTYYAKTNGTVDNILITQGKDVSAGDVLVTINGDIAKAEKAKAEATFKSAKANYDRDVSLLKKKVISIEVLSQSKVTLKTAKANLVAATNKYEDMIITAPYNGYVGVVNARVGDDVKTGDYLFSLLAKGDKTIFIELPENMFGKIDENSTVHAKDIDSQKIQGRVIAISNYLNDNGTITAKLAFPEDSKLVHGSYVEVEIIFDQHEALAVPEKILLKNNQGNFVYKITEDNKVKQVYVTTGTRTDNMIEIISEELQAGDSLVMEGLTKVYDGAFIEIISDNTDPLKQNNDN